MHHMMVYLMRYANMRYAEVINARADLKTGTLIPDFPHNMLIIHGKGRGGLSQRRTTPFLPANQREFLDFLEWRKRAGVRSEWLFVNQYGGKWADNSGHFNNWLRTKGRDHGFTEDEVKLLTTHKVGRHAYGTDMTVKGLPERLLADNMGIRNPAILTRYQNPTDEIRVQETMKYMNKSSSRETAVPKVLDTYGEDERRKRELLELLITGKISQDTFKMAIELLNS